VTALAIANLTKTYWNRGERVRALDDVSFIVPSARTLAVVGPSGAGKTTLLRVIAGLESADAGGLELSNRSIVRHRPQARRAAMVFQDDALIPHLTLVDNFRLAARARAKTEARIDELARTLGIDRLLRRRPRELSGGERQRASLARALLSDPQVLLLDEPLAHIDPSLRAQVRADVMHVRERFAGPIVYVSHDHAEAMSVADELAILIDGRLEQIGEPQRVYDAPATIRAARFLGTPPMNLLEGVTPFSTGNSIAGVRAENITISDGGEISGRVVRVERTGADALVHVATNFGTIVARCVPSLPLRSGDDVKLAVARDRVVRYDARSGALVA
jgi:ABC-type sugar transport system ATPase subunit